MTVKPTRRPPPRPTRDTTALLTLAVVSATAPAANAREYVSALAVGVSTMVQYASVATPDWEPVALPGTASTTPPAMVMPADTALTGLPAPLVIVMRVGSSAADDVQVAPVTFRYSVVPGANAVVCASTAPVVCTAVISGVRASFWVEVGVGGEEGGEMGDEVCVCVCV